MKKQVYDSKMEKKVTDWLSDTFFELECYLHNRLIKLANHELEATRKRDADNEEKNLRVLAEKHRQAVWTHFEVMKTVMVAWKEGNKPQSLRVPPEVMKQKDRFGWLEIEKKLNLRYLEQFEGGSDMAMALFGIPRDAVFYWLKCIQFSGQIADVILVLVVSDAAKPKPPPHSQLNDAARRKAEEGETRDGRLYCRRNEDRALRLLEWFASLPPDQQLRLEAMVEEDAKSGQAPMRYLWSGPPLEPPVSPGWANAQYEKDFASWNEKHKKYQDVLDAFIQVKNLSHTCRDYAEAIEMKQKRVLLLGKEDVDELEQMRALASLFQWDPVQGVVSLRQRFEADKEKEKSEKEREQREEEEKVQQRQKAAKEAREQQEKAKEQQRQANKQRPKGDGLDVRRLGGTWRTKIFDFFLCLFE